MAQHSGQLHIRVFEVGQLQDGAPLHHVLAIFNAATLQDVEIKGARKEPADFRVVGMKYYDVPGKPGFYDPATGTALMQLKFAPKNDKQALELECFREVVAREFCGGDLAQVCYEGTEMMIIGRKG